MNVNTFANKYRVRMETKWADSNPNMDSMPAGSAHWKCTLRCGNKRMTVYFSQGPAICKEPTVGDVLDCLASDACGFERAKGFEDWCGEYGFDVDSRRAEKTYRAIERQSEGLRRILGTVAYETLIYHTDRL